MRALGACLTSLLALGGCFGGGGSGGVGGTDGTTPSRAQLDLPLTMDPASFETPEYRLSRALAPIGASTLYAAGGTGAGVTVGIVDTGIDPGHPEFVGAIHPASRDLFSRSGGLADGSGHGTAVAGLLGARRNGVATHGVAFDAELLVVRADNPGSCPAACTFRQGDLAAATDHAVANGARVLNFSLGSDTGLGSGLRQSLAAAAAADRVLVLAAGNGAAASPHQPGAFAATAAAGGAAIVVGALGEDGTIAAFSNRAGSAAEAFLVAPGDELITTAPGGETGAIFSGTSAATPLVAGAAAALLSAAPHLSATDVVSILLTSARDLGAPGTDPIYGRGALDLENALLPMGPLTVPEGVSTNQTARPLGATSLAMGDAFGAVAPVLGPVLALDSFARPYAVTLETRAANGATNALPALLRRQSAPAASTAEIGGLTLGLTESDPLSPWAMGADHDLSGLAMGYRAADDSWRIEAQLGDTTPRIVDGDQLSGARRSLDAPAHFADLAAPLGLSADAALAGAWRVSMRLAGDPGGALAEYGALRETGNVARRPLPEGRLAALGLEHRSQRDARLRLGFGQLEEGSGPLGSAGEGGLAAAGALTRYVDVAGSLPLGAGWRTYGEAAIGQTAAAAGKGGLLAEVGPLWTTAFAVGIIGEGLWRAADRFTLELRQPLRVEAGRAAFDLPVARDVEGRIYRERRLVDLAPAGRELNLELGYALDLGTARLQTALLLRHAPGHDADAPPELLGAVALRLPF